MTHVVEQDTLIQDTRVAAETAHPQPLADHGNRDLTLLLFLVETST